MREGALVDLVDLFLEDQEGLDAPRQSRTISPSPQPSPDRQLLRIGQIFEKEKVARFAES